MSVTTVAAWRSLAFGSVADGIWGAASLVSEDEGCPVVLAGPHEARTIAATVEGQGAEQEWQVVSEGVELSLSPLGPASEHPDASFDQLVRVEGRFSLEREHSVNCLGWRAAHTEQITGSGLESFRQVAAWFEPGEGMALLAVRPKSAQGQEGDQLTAAVLDLQNAAGVADPRLSTTYSGHGSPCRAGLELWIGADEDEEQYPRRAAGEAIGQPATWSVGLVGLHAQLFSWHSRGEDGAGIYLLGTMR